MLIPPTPLWFSLPLTQHRHVDGFRELTLRQARPPLFEVSPHQTLNLSFVLLDSSLKNCFRQAVEASAAASSAVILKNIVTRITSYVQGPRQPRRPGHNCVEKQQRVHRLPVRYVFFEDHLNYPVGHRTTEVKDLVDGSLGFRTSSSRFPCSGVPEEDHHFLR